MDFAIRLDRLLLLSETSNYALSKEIGVSDSLISAWRSGKKKPTMENICKIAKFFRVSTDYLLCLSDDKDIKGENIGALTDSELNMIHAFRDLTDAGQATALTLVKALKKDFPIVPLEEKKKAVRDGAAG